MWKMRKTTAIALGAATVALCASCALMAGCGGAQATSDSTPAGAPPLMPAGHVGRYENLGPEGCYGCHGANEKANPMLASASALPADHYAGADVASLEIDPAHAECQTCHAQG